MVGDAPSKMPPTDMPPEPTTPVLASVSGGSFHPVAPYNNLAGRALMVRKLDGATTFSIAITGVPPTVEHTAHVHVAPCASQGGGHYKLDPTQTTPSETNELWLRGTSNANGALIAEATFTHRARGEALSIVVHDPSTGSKMACADLLADDPGTIDLADAVVAFPTNTAADKTVSGTVKAKRGGAATSFDTTLTGLDPAALGYAVHVYGEPCSVASGGDPYKMDPLVASGTVTNEISIPVTGFTTGMSAGTIAVPHGIRTDAQSIVIERSITATTTARVACANLTRMTAFAALESEGTAQPLQAAGGMSLTGTAVMTRKLTGVTVMAVVMTGLEPQVTYAAHLHAQSCSASAGGGHYKIDRNISEDPMNEIGFALTADADGAAYDSTWFPVTAAADAASVVVHGNDGARLACFDLE